MRSWLNSHPSLLDCNFYRFFRSLEGKKIFLIIILRWIHGDPTTFLRKKLLSFSRKVVRSPWIYPLAMSLTLFTPNNNLFSLTCECSQFFKPFQFYCLAIDRHQWGMKNLKWIRTLAPLSRDIESPGCIRKDTEMKNDRFSRTAKYSGGNFSKLPTLFVQTVLD